MNWKVASAFTSISDVVCHQLLSCSTNRRGLILKSAYGIVLLIPWMSFLTIPSVFRICSTHKPIIAYSHHLINSVNQLWKIRHRKIQYWNIFLHLFFGWYLVAYGAKLMQSTITDRICVRPSIIENIWGGNRRTELIKGATVTAKTTLLAIQNSNANSFGISKWIKNSLHYQQVRLRD